MTKYIKNKKRLVICLITFFILLGLFTSIWVYIRFFKTTSPINVLLDQNNLIAIKQDDLYGYINKNGKQVIDYKYQLATDFKLNYAKVKENDTCHIINKKGEIVLTANSCDNIIYNDQNATWIIDERLYNYKLNPIVKSNIKVSYANEDLLYYKNIDDNKIGLMSSTGKIIYSYDCAASSCQTFTLSTGNTDSSLIGKYGVILIDGMYEIINNATGKVIYEFTSNEITPISNNIFKEQINSRTYKYLYLEENRVVYESEDNEVIQFYNIKNKILELLKQGTRKYYDLENKQFLKDYTCVLELRQTKEFESKTDYHLFLLNNKYGLKQGTNKFKTIIKNEYNNIYYINHELYDYINDKTNQKVILLETNNETILYDFNHNKNIISFNSSNITTNNKSTFIVEYSNNIYTVYNTITNKSKEFSEKIELYSNYVKVANNIYNTNLEQII